METFVDFAERTIAEQGLDESSLRAVVEGGPKVFFVQDVAERIAPLLSGLSDEQIAYMSDTWSRTEVQSRVHEMDPVTYGLAYAIGLGLAWTAMSRMLSSWFGPQRSA